MKKYVYLILTILLSLVLGVFYIDAFFSINYVISDFISFLILFAFIVIGVFLATLTYDLGRLLFVKMAKFHIVAFKILNKKFYKKDGKFKVVNYPHRDYDNDIVVASEKNSVPYDIYFLGGIFTNLIFSIILTLTIIFLKFNEPTIELLLIIIGFIFTFNALLNVLPLSFLYSDGYYYLNILKDEVASNAFINHLNINDKLINGKPLEDLNFSIYKIDNLNNDYNDPLILKLKTLETYHYLFKFQFKEALDTIDYTFKKSNKMLSIYRKSFTNLKLICLLLNNNNDESLNLYLSLNKEHKKYVCKCKTIDDSLVSLITHIKIDKNNEAIEKDLDSCNQFIENTPFIGEKESVKSLINLMLTYKK